MNLTKTFTLYKLDDCTFTLDDSRSSRTLDKFGKTAYSVTDNEDIWLNEEYERRHGTPTFILDVWLRYYKASELSKPVSTITTPVNALYRHLWGATPLVSLRTADKAKKAPRHILKDKATLHETYWDNVLFNIHALESFKVRDIKQTRYVPGTKAETFKVSDKERSGYTKKALHSLSITEKQSKRLTILRKDKTAVTDAYKRKLSWKRSPKEAAVLLNDKARSTTKKAAKETVQMKERPIKAVFINPSEVVLIVDHVTAFFNWFRTVQESIQVADKRLIKTATLRKDAFSMKDVAKKASTNMRYDSFAIADKGMNGADKHANEAFALADGRRYDLNAARSESITVTPILAKRLARGFSETFGIMSKYMSHAQPLYTEQAVTFTDDEKKLLDIVRNEMVNITEIYWDNVLFLVHIADNINVSDALRKTAEVQLYDSFRFLDHLHNGAGVNSYEDVAVAESGRRMIEKSLYDSLHVLDELRKDIRRITLEKVAAMDSMSRALDVVRKDAVNVAEVAAKDVRFPLRDAFHIEDMKRKAIVAAKTEKFSMIDTIVKKTLAVRHDSFTISDEYRKMWRTVKTLREELKVLDKMARDIHHTIDDRLTIADGI